MSRRQDTNGLSVDEAVKRIRGKAGTQVKWYVRDGQKQEATITREVITIPSVETSMKDNNICYIQYYALCRRHDRTRRKGGK